MAKRKRNPRKSHDVDIVIPVFGQPEHLGKCLEAIPKALGNLEAKIILVDDQGPDQDKLNMIYTNLNNKYQVIRNEQNLGFPRTINTGVAKGRANLILLLNTDCYLDNNAIEIMAKVFEQGEKIGIVGPKLLFGDGQWNRPGQSDKQGTIQHAGIAFSMLQNTPIHASLGWPADHPKVNEQREMQAITGACMMTRRKVWDAVRKFYNSYNDPTTGALNEVYSPGTYEDVEFCFVARELGYKTIYEPNAKGVHYVGGSSARSGMFFPLNRNASIFNARCGHAIVKDEWKWT